MNKLLTIGLPTFNRAQLLDKQLAWLAQAIKGFESQCEIIVSDNCSPDDTRDVIKNWQPMFASTTFRVNRQSENVGAIKNIAYCMNAATGKHVWTIGDDDRIEAETLAYVLRILSAYPDLALMILNFSTRNVRTGKLDQERWFDIENEDVTSNGKAMFERCLQVGKAGGVALTTALVYRTDLAQCALREWPTGLSNTGVQIYITGFCALHGSVKVTKDIYLECATGTHFWKEDNKIRVSFRYAEMPEVYVKLMEIGYSKKVCRRMVHEQSREIRWRFIIWCLRRWPITTIKALGRHLIAVWRVHFG